MALQSAYLGDLVITAYRQIVGRAPALPRRIVSHNLDCGVVYGAYIVSYDNVTSGPKLEILISLPPQVKDAALQFREERVK